MTEEHIRQELKLLKNSIVFGAFKSQLLEIEKALNSQKPNFEILHLALEGVKSKFKMLEEMYGGYDTPDGEPF